MVWTSISSTSSSPWMAELVALMLLIAVLSTDGSILQAAEFRSPERQFQRAIGTLQPLARHCWAPVLAAIMAC